MLHVLILLILFGTVSQSAFVFSDLKTSEAYWPVIL